MKKAPHFTRKPLVQAVTATVLALSGEFAMGACPAADVNGLITFTANPDGPCSLGSGESISVEFGARVQGASSAIDVTGISDAGYIIIQPFGEALASTGAAILVQSSNVTSISNSGVIYAQSGAQTGILIRNTSSVTGATANTGNIFNGGSIFVTAGSGTGIKVDNSTVDGTITIGEVAGTSGGGSGYAGLMLVNSASVTGNVISNGTVAAQYGIQVNDSDIDGDISNTGIMNANGIGIDLINGSSVTNIVSTGPINLATTGIHILSSNVSGNVSSSGNISASVNGIYVNSSTVGNVSNSGIIGSSATPNNGINILNSQITGDVTNANGGRINADTVGIYIHGAASDVDGNVINSGTIAVGAATNNYGIHVYSANVDGGISNTGAITAGQGIYIQSATVVGDINSTGSIDVDYDGITITQSTFDGNVINAIKVDASGGIINATGDVGILINQSTGTGGDVSNSGTITAQNGIALISSSIVGNINNTTTGAISASSGTGIVINKSTVTGDIINSGTITGSTRGVYIFNTSTVTGSFINNGSITGSSYSIYVDASSSLTSIDIGGANAHLIGDVFAQNTDVNVLSGADFTSEGGFDVNQFNIAGVSGTVAAAVFHMANDITATGGVSNNGTLSVAEGDAVTITGNYTQYSGGVFQVGALDTGSYGTLNVTGTADLDDASAPALIDVNLTTGYSFVNGDVLDNVLTAGTLTTPGTMTVTDNSFIWDFIATNDGTGGLDLTANTSAAANAACADTYCEGASNTILAELGAGNTIFQPYSSLDSASFKAAASQATPELANENLHVIAALTDAVIDALPNNANASGSSSGDAMMAEPGKAWIKPYGAKIQQDARDSVDGYDSQALGVVFGADTELSNGLMVGGAIAYGTNELDGTGLIDGQSIDSDVYQGIVYVYKDLGNNTHVAAQALVGESQNDSTRDVALFSDQAKASYDSWFTSLRGEVGYDYKVNDELVITPSFDANYIYVSEDSYTEKGSVMNLHVNSRDEDSLVLGADAAAAYTLPTTLEDQWIALTAHLGLGYNVLDSQSSTKSNFVAGGPEFTTDGIEYDDVVFRGGIGIRVLNNKGPISGSINYDIQSGNDADTSIASASVKYKF